MGEHLLTVVKFRSSALRTENEIGLLVEEIRRWSSEKSRVIAVVSAIGKTTDRHPGRHGKLPEVTSHEARVLVLARNGRDHPRASISDSY
jgi:hypothetical protein